MNNKVSIALRVIAVLLAAGAVALFFLVKGEIDNANVKAKSLETAAATSQAPFDYTNKAKVKDLRGRMEIAAPALEEIQGRRKQKEADDTTIAQQKATIADRDTTISGLQADLEAKNTENAQLTRERDDFSSKAASFEAKASSLETSLANEKANTARLNEKIANMKTMDEYQAKLDEIVALEKNAEKAQSRYGRLRNYARSKGIVIPNDFPILVVGEVDSDAAVVQFESPYVLTTVTRVDVRKGLLVLNAGTSEKLVQGGSYDVEVDGVNVGKVFIAEASPAYVSALVLPGSDINAFESNTTVKLIPFIQKKK